MEGGRRERERGRAEREGGRERGRRGREGGEEREMEHAKLVNKQNNTSF